MSGTNKHEIFAKGLLLSTGWKLVSLRLSKPVANSICGTVHLPKLPMPELLEVEADVEAAAAALAVVEAEDEAAEELPVPATTRP